MAYTLEQLEALQAALVKGERRVTFADKTVEYRSIDEIKAAIRFIERELAAQAADTGLIAPPPRQIRITTGKGF